MRYGVICLLVAGCMGLGGCVAVKEPRGLTLENATGQRLESASLTVSGLRYVFPSMAPHSGGTYMAFDSALTGRVDVVWVADGKAGTAAVELPGPVPAGFQGQICFQIEESGEVRVFISPAHARRGSELPWGIPAGWEGSPSVPGLNRQ